MDVLNSELALRISTFMSWVADRGGNRFMVFDHYNVIRDI